MDDVVFVLDDGMDIDEVFALVVMLDVSEEDEMVFALVSDLVSQLAVKILLVLVDNSFLPLLEDVV